LNVPGTPTLARSYKEEKKRSRLYLFQSYRKHPFCAWRLPYDYPTIDRWYYFLFSMYLIQQHVVTGQIALLVRFPYKWNYF